MRAAKKITLAIIIGVVRFFAVGLTWASLWKAYYPEEYEAYKAEREELRKEPEQVSVSSPPGSMSYKELLELQKEREQQEAIRIEQMKELPESCKYVTSMDLDLYPTGKQCFAALNKRVEDWCSSQSDGNTGLAKDCVTEFYLKLAESCEGSEDMGLLSISTEVCLMETFQDLYPKLIPEGNP